ncbi:hypothetical protein LguiB_026640 [Lonicera macranthoides]
MLTGRESLLRLVGKRRRFLPNRHSLLSPTIQGTLSPCKDGNGGSASIEGSSNEVGESLAELLDCDWVTCPVCGNKVRGEDYMINSHLDTCLTRGTKRKLSQRTLLQLNFCAGPKEEILSKGSQFIGTSAQTSPNNLRILGSEENNSTNCKSPSKPAYVMVIGIDTSVKNLTSDVKFNYRVDSPSLVHENEKPKHHVDGSVDYQVSDVKVNYRVDSPSLVRENEVPKDDMDESLDNISGALLETFIVGLKFGDGVEINPGASISLMRDPNNPKDLNAVKVLSADSGCGKVFGFLPRELAQYMSPLMGKFGLRFEGNISSALDNAFTVVPIQILCQNKIDLGDKEFEELQLFKSLWRKAIQMVESMKTCPPTMSKYQQNFVLLIQEVIRTNSYLLTDDEKTFLETFFSLSDDSQRLFVRLYTRKGPWFRMSNISYAEISDCQQAGEGLSAAGYACCIQSTKDLLKYDLEEILNLLTVGELREIYCTINKKRNCGLRKQDFISSILSSSEHGSCPFLPNLVLEKTGACIQLSLKAVSLVWRAERLFFLNGEQDLSAFLLVDLGIVKYPTYNCIISDQIFSCRSDLLSYEEAIEIAQIMDQFLDENNSEMVLRCIEISNSRMSSSSVKLVPSLKSESMASFFSCFSASWVYSKVVLLGVSFLEHENRYDHAINLLKRLLLNFTSDRRRGYWTLRLSVDLEHVGRLNESLLVAEDGLLDPYVRAGSRISLQRRVLRLGKPPRRWKTPSFSESVKRKITEVHVQGRPLNCSTGMKSRFYGEDGEQCGVEELALQYYAGEEGGCWQGVHTESGIWLTIFGLLMWDIIFADVPNVFRTRFQTAPLDMETDSFYEVRKSIIEPVLQKIQEGMAEEIIITSWEANRGTSCRGLNWDRHSLTDLRAVVSCVGGPCLALICRHLAQDYRSWSSGMPDLLLWRFHGDYSGEAKLVEVKGPRDRLSEQQRAWLLFLMDSGFKAEVCRVSPAPVSI